MVLLVRRCCAGLAWPGLLIGKAGLDDKISRWTQPLNLHPLSLALSPLSLPLVPAKFSNPPCRLEQGKFKVSVQSVSAAAHSNLDPGPSLPLAGTCTMALL